MLKVMSYNTLFGGFDGEDGWRFDLVPLRPDNPAMAQIRSLVVTGHARVEAIEIDKGGGDVDRLSFVAQAATAGQPSPDESALLQAPHT